MDRRLTGVPGCTVVAAAWGFLPDLPHSGGVRADLGDPSAVRRVGLVDVGVTHLPGERRDGDTGLQVVERVAVARVVGRTQDWEHTILSVTQAGDVAS
jgi:hypothetical protein